MTRGAGWKLFRLLGSGQMLGLGHRLIAFLALGMIWSTDARAGCSNHNVTSRYQMVGKSARLEILSLAGSVTSPWDGTPRNAPAQSPCSGALCSGNPASAPAPITTSLPLGDGEWALAASTMSLARPGSRVRAQAHVNPRSIARARSIFHPPRFQVAVLSF